MNIWIDIAHVPQYNFYRWLICKLAADGHTVYLTVLDRGKLKKIVQKEIGGTPGLVIDVIGRHRSTKMSAILEANFLRNLQLLTWAHGKRIDVGFSNGYQLAMVGALKGFPSYSFDDDPETIDYRPKLWFNKETNYCIYRYDKKLSPKAHILPVLKEWAYLAPSYFSPDSSVLDEYGLTPKSYIFVREVSVGTVNYSGQAFGAVRDVADKFPAGMKVLLSLEKKDTRSQYPEDWILLKEPLKDVHSLIYYSSALVSSGDSMAREAALLGVPSYYLGKRHYMPANKAVAELADLQNETTVPFSEWVNGIGGDVNSQVDRQNVTRGMLADSMMDINAYMLDIVSTIE